MLSDSVGSYAILKNYSHALSCWSQLAWPWPGLALIQSLFNSVFGHFHLVEHFGSEF
jgi:hypothetical protein